MMVKISVTRKGELPCNILSLENIEMNMNAKAICHNIASERDLFKEKIIFHEEHYLIT